MTDKEVLYEKVKRSLAAIQKGLDGGASALGIVDGLLEPKELDLSEPLVLVVDPSRADHNPESFARTVVMFKVATGRFVGLVVHGYNDDERILADIPEVRTWFERFVKAGGMTAVDPTGEQFGLLVDAIMLAGFVGVVSGLLPWTHDGDGMAKVSVQDMMHLEWSYRPSWETAQSWLVD